ncbi:uncharacterized protein LOC128035482 [Gossypium raimondii]|uniref:uncharacterized protein LOC128035482 n=1 Tax=Gossypium raimondii TaxID=29730 RepID=UPI00227B6D69|nr:uncharacterized protein LOC128035482 [Gossypium raimondii]
MKVFDCVIDYHPGKANVVAEALSRKVVVELRAMFAQLSINDDGSLLVELKIKLMIFDRIKSAQLDDDKLHNRICVSYVSELKELILREAHDSPFALHPGEMKMYCDLRESYRWPGMNIDVVEYVVKYYTCQRVKAEHHVPTGLLQPISIPE